MRPFFISIIYFFAIVACLLAIWYFPKLKTFISNSSVKDVAGFIGILTAIIGIPLLLWQIEIGGKFFAADHRPFVFIETLGENQLSLSENTPSEIYHTFVVKNTGKSIARNVRLEMGKACWSDKDVADKLALENCFNNDPITIMPRNTFGSFTLYPEEVAKMTSGSKIVEENLQTKHASGKRIYIKYTLSFDGPDFPSGYQNYSSSLVLKLSSEGLMALSKEEMDTK